MAHHTPPESPPLQAPSITHSREIEVTWGDCDAAGVVFYPRFYAFFDTSTHSLLSASGLDHHTLRSTHGLLGTPLVKASAEFLSPATYGDVLQVTSTLSKLGGKSFTMTHRLAIGGRVVAIGEEIRVWAISDSSAPHGMKAVAPTPQILARLLSAR